MPFLSRLFLGRFAESVVPSSPAPLTYDARLRRNVLPRGTEAISLLQLGTYRTDVKAPGEGGDDPAAAMVGTLLTKSTDNGDAGEGMQLYGCLGTLETRSHGEGDRPMIDALQLLGTTKTATGEHSDVAEWS